METQSNRNSVIEIISPALIDIEEKSDAEEEENSLEFDPKGGSIADKNKRIRE